jgi:hypothetical protein
VRNGANLFPIIGAVVALQALFPIASLATDGDDPEEHGKQAGEDRWVPSLAITSGVTIQQQDGSLLSGLLVDVNTPPDTPPVALQPECDAKNPQPSCPGPIPLDGDDLAVSPFVGGSLELMTPALPIPTRPRLFVSGEILPTFAVDRDLALDGDPGCVRGPEPDAKCMRDEDEPRPRDTGEDSLNGEGSSTSAQIDTLVFGASLGVAFPVRVGKRQLRIKPSVGWINYKVDAEALVVDASCNPVDECTVVKDENDIVVKNTLRERTLTASGSQRFNGIGPGLDIEMDAVRYGPLGVSLFMGGRAYAIVDDRTLSFGTEEFFGVQHIVPDDPTSPIVFGPETDVGAFEVKVDPWIFRAHVGIRFHWLGDEE